MGKADCRATISCGTVQPVTRLCVYVFWCFFSPFSPSFSNLRFSPIIDRPVTAIDCLLGWLACCYSNRRHRCRRMACPAWLAWIVTDISYRTTLPCTHLNTNLSLPFIISQILYILLYATNDAMLSRHLCSHHHYHW